MIRRVKVQWTKPAAEALRSLPLKVRRAILEKTAALRECDPRTAYKRLGGPLRGYHSIKTSRYRTLYRVDEEQVAGGDVLVNVKVLVVLVGPRAEGDRRDVYALAERLIKLAAREIDRIDQDDCQD